MLHALHITLPEFAGALAVLEYDSMTHLKQRLRASAAAVPSSRSEAFATSMPVRSATMVWKLSRLSRRPWATSGW